MKKIILKNALISLLMATWVPLFAFLFHALMYEFPKLYDAYCRMFCVAGTLCSRGEAMASCLECFLILFVFFMIALCVDDVKQIKTKGKKGGE